MFLRPEIQRRIDDLASLPHRAAVTAPYAFEIRPATTLGDPSYRVIVERFAFQLRATVVPDYLAMAIVAAIVAGAKNNPARLTALEDELKRTGWEPEIELSARGFRMNASLAQLGPYTDEDLIELGTGAAVALSEFVLDQLVVTRPAGEMRPAVERSIGSDDAAELWLYDPSERDRSTQVHRSLENWLIARLRERGVEPMDPAGEPFFDLAWKVKTSGLTVCEVKSTSNSEVHQLRLGLGQILQYAAVLERSSFDPIVPCLLVEAEPRDATWTQICSRHGVVLFWPALWDEVAPQVVGDARR